MSERKTKEAMVCDVRPGDRVVMSPEPHYAVAVVKEVCPGAGEGINILFAMGQVETWIDLDIDCRVELEIQQ